MQENGHKLSPVDKGGKMKSMGKQRKSSKKYVYYNSPSKNLNEGYNIEEWEKANLNWI